MALIYSSSIVTDGLVFYYDAGNTKKSYLGKPATNLITNGDFAGGLNAGTGGTGGDNPLNEVVQFANPGDSPYCLRSTAVGGNTFTEYQLDLSGLAAGTTYVMSCWYYFDPAWNGTQAVFHSRAFSASGANTATGSDTGTAVETRVVNGVTWTRAYRTITTPADATGTFNWYLGYPSGNTAGFRYFTNVQFEVGSYPSPFVKGTRSSTQSVVDLTGNNAITISSLTYSNNATTSFSFNGSSNFLTCGNNSAISAISGTTAVSVEVWVNLSGYGSSSYGVITHKGNPWAWLMENPSNRMQIRFGLSVSGDVACADSATHALNTWYQFVGTYDGANMRFYRNGVLTNTVAASGTLGGTGINMVVGNFSGAYYSQGQIPVVKIYNKTLTAAEIQQNFNALRGRYGL